MNKKIWKIMLFIGILPFLIPEMLGLYRIQIESWTMIDWLVLYSFVYWPTYLAGLILILVSVYKLMDSKEKTDCENNRKTD